MELNKADFIQIEDGIKMREKKFGNRLYHYTSLNTFLCMVRTREIWMSSTGSMNDRKETTYFIELLEKELKTYCRQDFLKKYILKFLQAINMLFVYLPKKMMQHNGNDMEILRWEFAWLLMLANYINVYMDMMILCLMKYFIMIH